jgi:hypothetical protein
MEHAAVESVTTMVVAFCAQSPFATAVIFMPPVGRLSTADEPSAETGVVARPTAKR